MSKKRHRGVKKPDTTPASRVSPWQFVVFCGVAVAALVTPLTLLPGANNVFGPPKLLALCLGAVVASIGIAMSPAETAARLGRATGIRALWPFAAVLVLLVLSAVFSVDRSRSLTGVYPEMRGLVAWLASGIVGVGAVALLVVEEDGQTHWRRFTRLCIVATALVALGAIAQVATADRALLAAGALAARPRSTLGNASNLGLWLATALPVVLAASIEDEETHWRLFGWVSAALGLSALLLSLSRGAWIGAATAVVLVGAFWASTRARRPSPRLIAAVLAAVVAGSLVLTVIVPKVGSRLSEATDASSPAAHYRLTLWAASSRMATARPVLGWGPATFGDVFPSYRRAGFHRTGDPYRSTSDPHNATLSLAQEAGPLAAVLLLTGLGWLVVGAWRKSESAAGPRVVLPLAGLVAGFVAAQFHFITLDVAGLLVVLVAFVACSQSSEEAPVPEAAKKTSGVAIGVLLVGVAAALCAASLATASADRGVSSARAALAGGDWSSAQAELDRARALTPFTPIYDRLAGSVAGQWMATTGDDRAGAYAAAAFAEADAHSPDPLVTLQRADFLVVKAARTRDQGTFQEARELYRRVERDDPTSPGPALGIGTIAALDGDLPAARRFLEASLVRDRRVVRTWSVLERVYGALGETDKAREAAAMAKKYAD